MRRINVVADDYYSCNSWGLRSYCYRSKRLGATVLGNISTKSNHLGMAGDYGLLRDTLLPETLTLNRMGPSRIPLS